MKTDYKPIAMRCTQEQFDSIKDRIPLNIDGACYFEDYPYLANYYDGDKIVTTIKRGEIFNYDEKINETFDGELFLDCCGREKNLGLPLYDEFRLWYASKKAKYVDEIDFDIVIKELLKNKVWHGSELQYRSDISNSWSKLVYVGNDEYRIKPQPDYSKEIEALENKVKENGQKVIIKIE